MTDAWDPGQYHRFQDERSQPFHDLLALTEPVPGGRVVDLGCGSGELTRVLHEVSGAAETVGVDSSVAMLAKAADHAGGGLMFEEGDIADWPAITPVDLLFSNAALQWVDDHEALIPRLTEQVAPGGQFAVQMPANFDHASHRVAAEVAAEEPFRAALGRWQRTVPVRAPEWYAAMLHRHGFERQVVRLQVYGHVLASREEVVEWVKGTLLTDYRSRLKPEMYERFLERYREALFPRLEDERPFFYPFKRILLWGRKAG